MSDTPSLPCVYCKSKKPPHPDRPSPCARVKTISDLKDRSWIKHVPVDVPNLGLTIFDIFYALIEGTSHPAYFISFRELVKKLGCNRDKLVKRVSQSSRVTVKDTNLNKVGASELMGGCSNGIATLVRLDSYDACNSDGLKTILRCLYNEVETIEPNADHVLTQANGKPIRPKSQTSANENERALAALSRRIESEEGMWHAEIVRRTVGPTREALATPRERVTAWAKNSRMGDPAAKEADRSRMYLVGILKEIFKAVCRVDATVEELETQSAIIPNAWDLLAKYIGARRIAQLLAWTMEMERANSLYCICMHWHPNPEERDFWSKASETLPLHQKYLECEEFQPIGYSLDTSLAWLFRELKGHNIHLEGFSDFCDFNSVFEPRFLYRCGPTCCNFCHSDSRPIDSFTYGPCIIDDHYAPCSTPPNHQPTHDHTDPLSLDNMMSSPYKSVGGQKRKRSDYP